MGPTDGSLLSAVLALRGRSWNISPTDMEEILYLARKIHCFKSIHDVDTISIRITFSP